MKPVWTLAATAVLLLVVVAPGGSQTSSNEPDYFPLPAGATWTYEAAGGTLITVKLTKQEDKKVGDAMVKHSLETTLNNMPVSSEVVAALAQGICRFAVDDKPVNPPLCFLALPAKKGKKWKVDSKVGDETITGEFEASEEPVDPKIPYFTGKEVKDVKVLVVKGINLKVNYQAMTLTCYFAPDVGIVRQVVSVAGVTADLRLKSYDYNK